MIDDIGGGASTSTNPAVGSSSGTDVPIKEYFLALRAADDRRYTEVAIEREKALGIANEARKDALQLARDIQTYKDEKANELREQINRERGYYASKEDVTAVEDKVMTAVKPIAEFATAMQSVQIARKEDSDGISTRAVLVIMAIGVLVSIIAIGVSALITLL